MMLYIQCSLELLIGDEGRPSLNWTRSAFLTCLAPVPLIYNPAGFMHPFPPTAHLPLIPLIPPSPALVAGCYAVVQVFCRHPRPPLPHSCLLQQQTPGGPKTPSSDVLASTKQRRRPYHWVQWRVWRCTGTRFFGSLAVLLGGLIGCTNCETDVLRLHIPHVGYTVITVTGCRIPQES